MEADDEDFCDRLPGQHTGRLSLELQASEAAEWQLRLEQMEKETQRLRHWIARQEAKIREQTTPATPSAAVGADGPGAGDTVPRSEYDKLVELLYQIGDIAHDASTGPERPDTYWDIRQMAYGFREHVEHVDDSKPTNCHNPESENTPPHNPVMGTVVGTATIKHQASCPAKTAPTVSPEVGKRYLTGDIRGLRYAIEWIDAKRNGNQNLKSAACEMLNDMRAHYEAAIARLQDGESINSVSQVDVPAESPHDWVTQDRVPLRKIDEFRYLWAQHDEYSPWCTGSEDSRLRHNTKDGDDIIEIRCRRKDLPPVPVEPPPLPSPWRPMTDDYPRDKVLWVARDDGLVYTERNPDEWPLAKAIAWMPAVTPLHPNSAPPVVPKTRTVTLREFTFGSSPQPYTYWSEVCPGAQVESTQAGRTAVVEVPE